MAIKGQAINVTLTAIDASTGKRKTGDSANIAVYLVKDGVAAARNDATAISETDATNCPGEYTVELDATDMNANTVVVTGKSSTPNIELVPVKIVTEVGKIADISGRIPDALVAGNLKADVIAISGDTTAADNAELMFDGTGYAGGTTKLQTAVASIATDAIGDISDAVIAGLGGATVTITSPVSQSNDVTILRDTDYTTEIAWTYTYSGSLTGYTAALHCAGAGITSHTVTIGGIAGAYTLTAAFTNAETAALDTCIDDYSITFTKTADNTVLPYGVEGVMVVRDWGGV